MPIRGSQCCCNLSHCSAEYKEIYSAIIGEDADDGKIVYGDASFFSILGERGYKSDGQGKRGYDILPAGSMWRGASKPERRGTLKIGRDAGDIKRREPTTRGAEAGKDDEHEDPFSEAVQR